MMAPNSAAITSALRQVIYYHLDNAAHDNALFFAERLSAQDPRSSESAHLLSLCHLRRGDVRSAYEVSKHTGIRGINLGCAWVFAQASLALEKYKEGITALEKARGLWSHKTSVGKTSATTRAPYPDTAAVLCLLGKLYRTQNDTKKAIACFEESLRHNPFMWDAFVALCDMGVNVRVGNVFKPSESLVHAFDQQDLVSPIDQKENIGCLEPLGKRNGLRTVNESDPFDIRSHPDTPVGGGASNSMDADREDTLARLSAASRRPTVSATQSANNLDGTETPAAPSAIIPDAHPTRATSHPEPPQAPIRKTRTAQSVEASLTDAAPRMMYRLGAKRSMRAAEKEQPHTSSSSDALDFQPAATIGLRSSIPAAERKRTISGHPVQQARSTQAQAQSEEPGAPQRRSARLNMFKPSTTRTNGTSAATAAASLAAAAAATREVKKARPPISRIMRPGSAGSSVGRVVSGNRKPLDDSSMDVDHGEGSRVKDTAVLHQSGAAKQIESDTARIEEALKWVLDLIRRMASGYYYLSQYQCSDSLKAFESLPKTQLDTPWAQAQMGRAHFEQAAYADAERFFKRVRLLAPTRLEDMEIYSTILWHLKRDTDLAFLAYELSDVAFYAPQTWCVVGNSCSLSKQPEQALVAFKRATQVNPKFAYAYTLQGHEHVASEEYDKALQAYRQALSADRRHYNAYYGIGQVYNRLGNYEKAYTHFHAASAINPTNPVLLCWIGTALERQKQIMPALQYFTRAMNLAPRAAQARYKRARALMAIGSLDGAHKELMVLKDLAPDEPRVHFMLGRLYRSMNERQLAVRHFSSALALDPRAAPQIKHTIESIEDDVGMEDSVI